MFGHSPASCDTASCDTGPRWWTIISRIHGWEQTMQDGLYAPVIGPSAILPRGFLWLAPIWYVGIAAALALIHWPAIWFRVTAAAGLFTAMLVFVFVLNSITTQAFTATGDGIELGLPAFSKRRGRRR